MTAKYQIYDDHFSASHRKLELKRKGKTQEQLPAELLETGTAITDIIDFTRSLNVDPAQTYHSS